MSEVFGWVSGKGPTGGGISAGIVLVKSIEKRCSRHL